MSQTYDDCIQRFCVRCEDVGLDCNCTIYGISGETVIDNTILHMYENHAIKPEEMITCMRLKIIENVQAHQSPPPTSHSSYNNRFSECRA
jgi:predicted small metal-binding protein